MAQIQSDLLDGYDIESSERMRSRQLYWSCFHGRELMTEVVRFLTIFGTSCQVSVRHSTFTARLRSGP
jgi:hypothetical protein